MFGSFSACFIILQVKKAVNVLLLIYPQRWGGDGEGGWGWGGGEAKTLLGEMKGEMNLLAITL